MLNNPIKSFLISFLLFCVFFLTFLCVGYLRLRFRKYVLLVDVISELSRYSAYTCDYEQIQQEVNGKFCYDALVSCKNVGRKKLTMSDVKKLFVSIPQGELQKKRLPFAILEGEEVFSVRKEQMENNDQGKQGKYTSRDILSISFAEWEVGVTLKLLVHYVTEKNFEGNRIQLNCIKKGVIMGQRDFWGKILCCQIYGGIFVFILYAMLAGHTWIIQLAVLSGWFVSVRFFRRLGNYLANDRSQKMITRADIYKPDRWRALSSKKIARTSDADYFYGKYAERKREMPEVREEFQNTNVEVSAMDNRNMFRKKYQVFVSSTLKDLRQERLAVMDALLESDCIPVGMEWFPSVPMGQMDYIKRMIDQCDYYLIVSAGRYGTIKDTEGKSYTELEYEYALSRNIPILGFLHKNIETLTGDKLEDTDVGRRKLNDFQTRLSTGKLCKMYENKDDLKSGVMNSIRETVELCPRPGWVRADAAERKISELQAEIDRLKNELDSYKNR